MEPKVSIIMGSKSDMPVMQESAKFLDELEIPFELNALSAHRTPEKVMDFAKNAYKQRFQRQGGSCGSASGQTGHRQNRALSLWAVSNR